MSSIAPMERYALHFLGSQGGGVFVDSNAVANFKDCDIHDNAAYLRVLAFCPCPELSSIAPMERYALHFLACRAVASLSTPAESPTLKAATSMTTPLLMCACIFEPFPELSSIAPLEC